MDDQLKQKAKLEPLRRVLDGEASEAQLDAMFEAIVEIVAMLDDGRLETAHHPVKFLLQTVSALQGTTVDTRDGTMRYDDPSCPSIARTMEGLRDQPQRPRDLPPSPRERRRAAARGNSPWRPTVRVIR